MKAGTSNVLSLGEPKVVGPVSLRAEDTLRGSLAVVSALDLLQWLCTNRQIWTIRFFGTGIDGEVVVISGQLVDARWGNLRGMEALCEIVGCHRGSFELVPVSGSTERTLSGSWQHLVLSAVQSLDEREVQRRPQHSSSERHLSVLRSETLEAVLAARSCALDLDNEKTDPTMVAPDGIVDATDVSDLLTADALVDRGFASLREGNLEGARQSWTKALALDPENRSILFNLRRLDAAAAKRSQ